MDLISSVPPRLVRLGTGGVDVGAAYQAACALSWVENDFRPRSLNAVKEVDDVPTLAGVAVEPFVKSDPTVAPNHPGPSLGNIFDVIASDQPCAIVNADVYLLGVPQLQSRLRDLCREGLVVARRTDVAALGGPAHGVFTTGIDFVAFWPNTVQSILEDHGIRQFQLGVTWWDYIFPIAASFLVPVRRIREPFLIHHAHEANWRQSDYDRVRKRARAVLVSFAQRQSEKSEVAREFLRRLGQADAGASSEDEIGTRFSLLCMEWLFGPSGPVQEIELPLEREDAVLWTLVQSTLTDPATCGDGRTPALDSERPETGVTDGFEGRATIRLAEKVRAEEASVLRDLHTPVNSVAVPATIMNDFSLFRDLIPRIQPPPMPPIGRPMTNLENLVHWDRSPRFREILTSCTHDLGGVIYLSGKALERQFRPALRRLSEFSFAVARKPRTGPAVARKPRARRKEKFIFAEAEVTYPLRLFQLAKQPGFVEIVKATTFDLVTIFLLLRRLSALRASSGNSSAAHPPAGKEN